MGQPRYKLHGKGWASPLGASPYNYNPSNQLTSKPGVSYAYDNNGNTLTKVDSTGTTSYNWDFENRLTSAVLPGSGGTVSFKYDPFGRRTQKRSSAGTTNYVYDGANVLDEVDNSGSVLARYVQGAGVDEPLAETRGSTTSYYEADGLGSVTSLSNSSGALANTYTYDSFGNLTASTGTVTNPYRYTGRDFDVETGLYYYRARYYDPLSGRFISEDPIGFFGARNFYGYVGNDPVQDVDSSGLNPITKSGTGTNSYCMNTILGQVCWGNKKHDLMQVALQHSNLACCVRKFFGNDFSLNMANLPSIDASHDLRGATVGRTNPSDNLGQGRGVVQIDRGSFGNLAFDDEFLILTYLHETANALAQHLFTDYRPEDRGFLGPMGAYPSWQQQHDPWDPDIGNQFEKCLTAK